MIFLYYKIAMIMYNVSKANGKANLKPQKPELYPYSC